MTASQRISRIQRVIAVAAVTRALAWGVAAVMAIAALVAFAQLASPSASTRPAVYQWLAIAIGAAIVTALLWRSRQITSRNRVALWIEEQVPDLQYSLVTALEQSDSQFLEGMESRIQHQDLGRATRLALRRPMLTAAAAVVVSLALLYVSPSGVFGRAPAGSPFGRFSLTPSSPAANRLEGIEARITPPAYTAQRSTTLSDPSSVTALVGSTITIRGKGSANGITAALDERLRVSDTDGGWSVAAIMPEKPAALRLRDRDYERIVVLAPQADAPPRIVLTSPAHDTALRTPRLVVQLNASGSDDIGLGDGHFEYLITTGSGEIFTARTVTTAPVQLEGARSASLSATLDLASLKLGEGDVVSMRAVARDRNSLSGPGVATSDTRTIRIVRASEYDSLSIEAAAPPPLDSSAISQRMLIAMTEQLVREQAKLARADVVKRSTDIGELEDRIRKRVREILNDGEESPAPAAQPDSAPPTVEEMESPDEINGSKNPDLATAYNSLWDAVRSLKIAEPGAALPPMRIALKALDRARLANRLYLRGTPPRIIVDLNRVRLSGKEKGSSSARTPRSFADSTRVRLSSRFGALVELIDKDPARAISELALMRVDALSTLPSFAVALGETSDAIRAGRDATLPLLRARRALDGLPVVTPALGQWSGGGEE